jgi:hypothetical protein
MIGDLKNMLIKQFLTEKNLNTAREALKKGGLELAKKYGGRCGVFLALNAEETDIIVSLHVLGKEGVTWEYPLSQLKADEIMNLLNNLKNGDA